MANNETHSDQHAADDDRSSRDSPESGDSPDESEPGKRLGDLDSALESQYYPTTNAELVEAYGDYEVETQDGWQPLEELLESADDEPYDSADDVRKRILGLINRR